MASKAYIDVIAVKLRNSGLVPGTLGQLRALALTDLTQGRNPLDRIIAPRLRRQPIAPSADDNQDLPGPRFQPCPAHPAPPPALINLLVPAGTLLGWGTAPGEAAGWGLLDTARNQGPRPGGIQAPENSLVRDGRRHRRERDSPRLRHRSAPLARKRSAAIRKPARKRHPCPGTGSPAIQPAPAAERHARTRRTGHL